MSPAQQLRAAVKQRLTAAVEEIFGLFERMITEYEEEASRSKDEIDRQRLLLDAVLNPEVRLPTTAGPPDVQQLLVSIEEVPPDQQDWSSSLDQEGPDPSQNIKEEQKELWTSEIGEQLQENPEPTHIKEEQEELWSSQEAEQLQRPEDAHITEFPFTIFTVPVMREDEEPETEDSDDDCQEIREPGSGLDSLQNKDVLLSHKTSLGENLLHCQFCDQRFERKFHLQNHIRVHMGKKPFTCSVCSKSFPNKAHWKRHMIVHTGAKPFSCSVCGKTFGRKEDVKRHLMIHTGEKPFRCTVCGRSFNRMSHVKSHKCGGERSSR